MLALSFFRKCFSVNNNKKLFTVRLISLEIYHTKSNLFLATHHFYIIMLSGWSVCLHDDM